MRIRVLGTTGVDGSAPLTGRDAKVLAALVVGFPDPVTSASLAQAVWGSAPPATWGKILQGSVSRLRRSCGAAAISTEAGGYRLTVDAADIDACRFEALVVRATAAVHVDPAAAARALDDADDLWRGEPLDALDRTPAVLGAVGRLEKRRHTADALRVEILLAAGRVDDAVAVAAELWELEPYDERRAGLLASALYRSGRPVDALNAVRTATDRLRDELGLDPGPELVDLELAILRRDPSLVPPAVTLATTATPVARPTFIGRVQEVEAVHAAVLASGVTTIVGPGGVGKTRLASHVVAALPAPVDVVVVELATIEAGGVVGAVARALGAAIPGVDMWTAVDQAVSGRRLLLVVDNCEHVRDETRRLIASMTSASPELVVLATSREPLGLESESVIRLDGLGDDALRLFGDLAIAHGCDDEQAGGPDAAALCERLGGLPLALELAAARTAALSPSEIRDHLDDDSTLLRDDTVGRPRRHRSLASVFDWSYDLLDDGERAVMDILAALPGGATIAALDAIGRGLVDGVAARVAGLVAASLVLRGQDRPGASRFRVHEALRPAARQRRGADVRQTSEERLVDWAVEWGQEAATGIVGPNEARWHAALEAERVNLGEAIRLALVQGRPASAATICRCIRSHVVNALDLEATGWYAATVGASRGNDVAEAADVVATLAMLQWLAGAVEDAVRSTHDVDAMPAASSDARALALHVRGIAAADVTLVEESVRMADTTNNPVMATSFRLPLVASLAATAPEAARARAAEAWELAARSGNPTAVASAHVSAATSLLATDPLSARRHYEVGRAMAVETGNRMLAAMVDVLASMGREGSPTDSLTAALDAAAALRDRGARIQAGMALLRAADLFASLGEQQTAAVLVRAVRRTGLADWRSLRPLLHLDHLGPDVDASDFAPMPLDLEAAIRVGHDACERRVAR